MDEAMKNWKLSEFRFQIEIPLETDPFCCFVVVKIHLRDLVGKSRHRQLSCWINIA